MKMKTFCYLQKKHPHQKSMKETDFLKADKNLTRLLIVARTRKVDLSEILTHCLSQFTSCLSNSNGPLQYNNKAALFHYLQAKFPDMRIIKIPQKTTLILNGMAIIQQLAGHVPATFGDLNIDIFRYIIKLASFHMSSRIEYNPLNIKDSERRQHLISPGYLLRTLNENQKTSIQFRKFLISGKNKESLVLFMLMHWKKLASEEFHGKSAFVSLSPGCFMLSPQNKWSQKLYKK